MPSILFVCTGNLYRSPLAAAFFIRKLQQDGLLDEWVIDTAGTWTTPGQSVPAPILRAAAKQGVNLENHKTKLVSRELLAKFDLVLVMENGHKEALSIEFPSFSCKVHLISEVVDRMEYDIPDPAFSGQDAELVAADMSSLIERGYRTICSLANDLYTSHPLTGENDFKPD